MFAAEYDEMVATRGSHLRDLCLELQDFCRNERVLEVAAGHGRWTRYVAQTATLVLAADASPRMLKQARELVAWNQELPEGRCAFLCLDAFEIDQAPGDFDVGFSVNWMEHIPSERMTGFLDAFHGKLGAGARVLAAINFFSEGSRKSLYRREGSEDWFNRRQRPNGSTYEIVDNPYEETDLRRILEPHAKDLVYKTGEKFFWITYQIT